MTRYTEGHTRIVVYSGGMDSFTLLHWARKHIVLEGEETIALGFNYGQRHRRELVAATSVCQSLGISRFEIDLRAVTGFMKGSSLTDDIPVPHGHYAEESMRQTVVPGRNTLMLAAALAFAEGLHPTRRAIIYYGAHSGDHHIYPDCRPDYVDAMRDAIREGSGGRISLVAPFIDENKSTILEIGLKQLGLSAADYANTWTCYEGGEHPCGKCGACVERAEAFADNQVADPLIPTPEPITVP